MRFWHSLEILSSCDFIRNPWNLTDPEKESFLRGLFYMLGNLKTLKDVPVPLQSGKFNIGESMVA